MVMVHGEKDQPGSRIHTGSREYSARQRVMEANRQKLCPAIFQQIRGPLTLNFFTSRATTQLEIGPCSSRDRCLSPTVGGESICQPTMDTDPMSSQ